jgi:hypothetical protein
MLCRALHMQVCALQAAVYDGFAATPANGACLARPPYCCLEGAVCMWLLACMLRWSA